jgi:hypothetical protein
MPNATVRSVVGLTGAKQERAATVVDSTVEVAATAAAGTEYVMARIPSRARIHGLSRAAWDDLASSGSPTLDFGLKAVDSNITSDDDALNDGLAASSASTGSNVVKNIADFGKQAWEYVNGQTVDPGGFLDVIITTKDAACNDGGTITLTLVYSVD